MPTYDASGRITRIEDIAGRAVVYTYDASGRLWKVTDPAGGVTEYAYDAANRHLSTKDPRGFFFVTNEYDAENRIARQTLAGGGEYEFDYTLDGGGGVVQTDVTNPHGYVRRLTFNADGYTLTDTLGLGRPEVQTTTYVRQAGTNFVLSATDALNRKTAYAYDSLGNVTSITKLADTVDAVTTTFTFDPTFSLLTSVTDPLNHVTSLAYDAQGNVTTITDPLDHETTYAYNTAGQAVSMTTPSGTTQFTYDGADVVSITDPLGRVTTRTYDPIGRVRRLTRPTGQTTDYEYDGRGDVTKMVDALGGETIVTYDPSGNLSTVTDARGRTTTYTWDGLNRMAGRTDPLLRAESFVYDALGDLQQVTDRKNQTTAYTYDALGRALTAAYHDSSSTSYTYDVVGRLTQVVDSIGGTITRTYDALDRLTSETTPEGSVTYTYDSANRRSTMTVAGQPAVSYTYDDANRVTSVTQGSATVSLAYDHHGNRSLLTLPNGITVEYTYDAASQLTEVSYELGAAQLGNLTYEYDASGRRTFAGGTWARTQLPAALASATYDDANQIATWAGAPFVYDDNGNITSDGSKVYTWNARNQLAGVTGPLPATFEYDGLERRRSRSAGGVETAFLYDRENIVQELVAGTPSAFVVSALDLDQWLTRTDAAGTHAFLADALGSTLALTGASGAVETEYTYAPFGATTATGAPSENPFQFTGRENDGAGMYYYRARYYDPTASRFLSEDPIQWAGGSPSFFAYVNNDPLDLTDPTGLGWWSCIKCFWKSYGDCSTSSKQCEKDLARKFPNPIDLCFSRNPPYTSPAAAALDICFFQNPACQKAWADCTACAASPPRPGPRPR